MSETELLKVEPRDKRGKHSNRRLREAGKVPAVLYGHGQESVALAVGAEAFDAVLRHGSRLVKLTGAVDESAFIRDCQWDTWGKHVMHVDFTRISAHEKVQVVVAVELRGEAPGFKAGGTVQHALHELEVECEAIAIPEKISVNINQLELHGSITVADLELPEGVRVLSEAEAVVVQCVEITDQLEEEAEAGAEAEPEIIGRKKEDEEEGDS